MDAALTQEDYTFWQDVLFRCIDEPTDVLEGQEGYASLPDHVDVYLIQDSKTQFRYDTEMNLCGVCSQEDYAEDFRRALHLLTQNATLDFKVSLYLYYLEHDPDLSVEYNRQELAA